jgi:hypothetical protein
MRTGWVICRQGQEVVRQPLPAAAIDRPVARGVVSKLPLQPD